MNRDQAITTARYWLSRQPPLFRYRWAAGPAALGREIGDGELPIAPTQLEQLLDVNARAKTGLRRREIERAFEAFDLDESEGSITFDPDDWRLLGLAALTVANRQETKDWSTTMILELALDMVFGMYATEMRPLLEAVLDQAPTVRGAITDAIQEESSWDEVLRHAELTDRVLADPTADPNRVREIIGVQP